MKFIKDNWLILIIGLFFLSSITGNGIGYKYFREKTDSLQQEIDQKQAQIIKLEHEKLEALKKISQSQEREKMLSDSLILSKQERNEIKKRYNHLYSRIHSSSDSEYLEYLRSRISNTN